VLLLCAGFALASADLLPASPPNPRFTGSPFLRTWNSDDYSAAPVNWDIVQHPRTGYIYAGNNYGALEFDGSTWRLYPMPSEGPARTIAIDQSGTVWLGGLNEVARLEPDARGSLRAVAVTHWLPPGDRELGNASRTLAMRDEIYISANRQLFRFSADGTARRLRFDFPITGLWSRDGELHLAASERGIMRLRGDTLEPVAAALDDPNVRDRATLGVLAARTRADGVTLLLGTRGPLLWRGPGTPLQRVSEESARHFAEEPATAAAFLPDGRLVFGFLRRGLHVFTAEGHLSQIIDESHGLPSNRIEEMRVDAESGLWVAQRSGLTRLQLDSPFALHGVLQGLPGSPRDIERFGDRLYVSNNQGLAWRDDATGRFQSVPSVKTGINAVTQIGSQLFATGNSILEIRRDNSTEPVLSLPSQLSLFPVDSAPGTFLVSGTIGVTLVHFNGSTWRRLGPLANVTEGIVRFLDGRDGTFWGVAYDGACLWRIDFRGGVNLAAPARRYTEADGIPLARRRDSPRLAWIGDDLLATCATWTRRFDARTDRFVAEIPVAGLSPDSGAIASTAYDSHDPWWMLGPPANQLVRLVPDALARRRVEAWPSGPLRRLVPNSLHLDPPTNTLWISGQGSLVSMDLGWKPAQPRPELRCVIRAVATSTGEVLFGGQPATHAAAAPLVLSSTQNALRFTFAAPTFEGDWRGKDNLLFRTQLDGFETSWTEWSSSTTRDFTNLPYRQVTFRVQARALDGRESPAATFAVVITPPWWLAGWALGGYALAGVGAIVGIVLLRTRTLRQRNQQLESLVAARTAELARLRQIDRDESAAAKLAEEKTRLEMLRYQLNPHFLYNALNSIRALVFTKPPAAGEMVSQLADLCRVTLTRNEEFGPVREEFEMLQLYLDMEKTRWREKLAVELELAPDAAAHRIPPFLLLPLVENALKHGRQSTAGVLGLRLSARLQEGKTLVLAVANTGRWLEAGTSLAPSTGIGLENLRQRLQRYYPGAHEIVRREADGWVSVTLELPAVPSEHPPGTAD
jgi:hypothetical protein